MSSRLLIAAACAIVSVATLWSGPLESDAALVTHIDIVSTAPFSHGLFSHARGDVWYQPLALYPSALLIAAGAPRDVALVLPSLAAVCLVIGLTAALARRAGLPATGAYVAVALLILTPGLLRAARTPGAAALSIATVLVWTVAVFEFVQRPRRIVLLAGAAGLGLSAYTQPSGVLLVAIMFAFGAVVLGRASRSWSPIMHSAIVLSLTLLPAGVWLVLHPSAYPDTFGRWLIHAAHIRNPIEGVVAFARWHVAERRVSDYWNYFSPTFLFASGQLFPLWGAILIPLGVWAGSARRRLRLVVAAVLVIPLAATMLDVARAAALVLPILPFGAVLAASGLLAITQLRRRAQVAAVAALAASAIVALTGAAK